MGGRRYATILPAHRHSASARLRLVLHNSGRIAKIVVTNKYIPLPKSRPPSGGNRAKWEQGDRPIIFCKRSAAKKDATKERGAWGRAPKQNSEWRMKINV